MSHGIRRLFLFEMGTGAKFAVPVMEKKKKGNDRFCGRRLLAIISRIKTCLFLTCAVR